MKTQIKQKIDDKHILHSFLFDELTLSYCISDVFIIVSQTQIIRTWATKVIHIYIIFYQKRGMAEHNPRFVTCRSSFWCSRTSDPALTRFPSWRTYSIHACFLWQTYMSAIVCLKSWSTFSFRHQSCAFLSCCQLLLNLLHVLKYSQT
jgi:hypothetical protein